MYKQDLFYEYQARYPDTYYALQPIVERVAEDMDDMTQPYPMQQNFDRMMERTYGEVEQSYPWLIGEEERWMEGSNVSAAQYPGYPGYPGTDPRYFRPGPFPGRFRQRDLARDLIAILLLNQLLRRRRIYW